MNSLLMEVMQGYVTIHTHLCFLLTPSFSLFRHTTHRPPFPSPILPPSSSSSFSSFSPFLPPRLITVSYFLVEVLELTPRSRHVLSVLAPFLTSPTLVLHPMALRYPQTNLPPLDSTVTQQSDFWHRLQQCEKKSLLLPHCPILSLSPFLLPFIIVKYT